MLYGWDENVLSLKNLNILVMFMIFAENNLNYGQGFLFI